jgi:NAD(P)-dependent dehydrogenase (short-subunit alcohol dehydrogenase family)
MNTRTVLITGALTGIGRATALAFAREGASIVVSGRHDDKGRALVAKLQEGGAEAGFTFVAVFAHSLEHTGGYPPEEARRVAGKLLPDLLRYDPTRPASFPDNGRTLTDDVQDAFLAILTNGKVTEDKVGPHGDLLAEFPYLGPPHNA